MSNAASVPNVTAAQPTASDPTTAAAVVSSNKAVNSYTKISSVEDLRKKAPKVYNAICQGIAEQICYQMKHAQDRIKQKMREDNQT